MIGWLELIGVGIGVVSLVLAIVFFIWSSRDLQREADELKQETRELRHLSEVALIAMADAGMVKVTRNEAGQLRQLVTAEGSPPVFPHVRGEGESLPPADTTS
jgi:hypothetical protein